MTTTQATTFRLPAQLATAVGASSVTLSGFALTAYRSIAGSGHTDSMKVRLLAELIRTTN